MIQTHKPHRRTAGFRLSGLDVGVLSFSAAGSLLLYHMEIPLWWLPAFAVGHFFLFCNVFRVARWRELVWAGVAVAGGFTLLFHSPEKVNLLPLLMFPVTAWAILSEIRSPRYHGIMAHRWNARLSEYLSGSLP